MTIAVDSICRVMHKTGALEPCDVWKAEAFSRFSRSELRSSNSITEGCTELLRIHGPRCCLNILSRLMPPTKRRLATVAAMYGSSCWVVAFGRPGRGLSEIVSVAQ